MVNLNIFILKLLIQKKNEFLQKNIIHLLERKNNQVEKQQQQQQQQQNQN